MRAAVQSVCCMQQWRVETQSQSVSQSASRLWSKQSKQVSKCIGLIRGFRSVLRQRRRQQQLPHFPAPFSLLGLGLCFPSWESRRGQPRKERRQEGRKAREKERSCCRMEGFGVKEGRKEAKETGTKVQERAFWRPASKTDDWATF